MLSGIDGKPDVRERGHSSYIRLDEGKTCQDEGHARGGPVRYAATAPSCMLLPSFLSRPLRRARLGLQGRGVATSSRIPPRASLIGGVLEHGRLESRQAWVFRSSRSRAAAECAHARAAHARGRRMRAGGACPFVHGHSGGARAAARVGGRSRRARHTPCKKCFRRVDQFPVPLFGSDPLGAFTANSHVLAGDPPGADPPKATKLNSHECGRRDIARHLVETKPSLADTG